MNNNFITLLLLYSIILILLPCGSSFSNNITNDYESISSISSSSGNVSCGDLLNVQCPFIIEGRPQNCGKQSTVKLECKNNRTIATLSSKRFYVMDINYTHQMIRLIDPGLEKESNCSSMPQHSLHRLKLGDGINTFGYGCRPVTYMNCSRSISDAPSYLNTSPCVKASFNMSIYAIVHPLEVSEFKNSCTNFFTSWIYDDGLRKALLQPDSTFNFSTYRGTTFHSYLDVHKEMMKGFWMDYYLDRSGEYETQKPGKLIKA
ncbi:hypothetical protein MKW98_017199 [Papaver atlanticum]|uniref:Wall-associated receptor kinase galacturonan-binding domain-containing protein n=1 Tax=Papaver atlanticum TaxID=357466 RepID=A0AAD4SCV8_9MAGN|nr:hypothetical protein MKW98_017199 [Papaver atlanticum]